jgi:hypothetical protein
MSGRCDTEDALALAGIYAIVVLAEGRSVERPLLQLSSMIFHLSPSFQES